MYNDNVVNNGPDEDVESVLLDDDLVVINECWGPWSPCEHSIILGFIFRKRLNCKFL